MDIDHGNNRDGQPSSPGSSGGASAWTILLGALGDGGILICDLKGDPALFAAVQEEAARAKLSFGGEACN